MTSSPAVNGFVGKFLELGAILIALIGPTLCCAQISSPKVSSLALEIQQANEAVSKVLDNSGHNFREGLLAIKQNRPSEAGEKFDLTLEVFLSSTINIQKDRRLQICYSQLIETVYRIEFPHDAMPPQIRQLSATCEWNWNSNDFKLADEVIAIVKGKAKSSNENPVIYSAKPSEISGDTNRQKVSSVGFNEQQFEPSPLDDLAKLELTPEEVKTREILRDPVLLTKPPSSVRTVTADVGDTIAKLATRNGADPVAVAKFNGLLPGSVLAAGREIKIPASGSSSTNTSELRDTANSSPPNSLRLLPIGSKPDQSADGKVLAVMHYFNEYLNDPYSMRFVRWSPIFKAKLEGVEYWVVNVKFRARNLMGAYVLAEEAYLIRNNKVVRVIKLDYV